MTTEDQATKILVFVPGVGGCVITATARAGVDVEEAISAACKKWIVQTFEGADAWSKCDGKFTIRQVQENIGDRRLTSLLSAYGLSEVSIAMSDGVMVLPSDKILVEEDDEISSVLKGTGFNVEAPQEEQTPGETPEDFENLSWDTGRNQDAKKE